jgi:Flp pilus assembly protein TadG
MNRISRNRPGWRRLVRDQHGAISIEWALIVPILTLAMMGAIDVGAAAIHRMQMANALRSGLQYASVRKPVSGDMSGVEDAVRQSAPPDELSTREITATYYCECPDNTTASCTIGCPSGTTVRYVRITMTEKYKPFLRLVPVLPEVMDMSIEGNIRIH